MARQKLIQVPETSGAGVSRFSYQHAYDLGQRGKGGLISLPRKLSTMSMPKSTGAVKLSSPSGARGFGASGFDSLLKEFE